MRGWMTIVGMAAVACGTASAPEDPTFHADVRPIFEANCVDCHQDGGIGPFSMAFDDASWADGPPDWVEPAVAAVEAGTMPPWPPAEDGCVPIEHSRALSQVEVDTVSGWAGDGFPVGDPAQYASPQKEKAEDLLPEPDLVLSASEPYAATTERPDDYRCFVVDHDFDEDAWVRAFTVEPDRAELVHHVIAYRLDPQYHDQVRQWDAADAGPGYTCYGSPGTWDADTLAGWAPGQQPEIYPEGVARRIAKGSTLVVQVHYNVLNVPDGQTAAPDQTAVKLWMLPEGEYPTQQLYSLPIADTSFVIPAGDPDAVVKQSMSLGNLPVEVKTIGVFPHMHQLGTRIRLTKEEADGGKSCVVDIPEWDFNWQGSYYFPEQDWITVEEGTRFTLTCRYDNSAENQPVVNGEQQTPRDVRWGDGTLDEMCLMYAHILVPPGLL